MSGSGSAIGGIWEVAVGVIGAAVGVTLGVALGVIGAIVGIALGVVDATVPKTEPSSQSF